jgi:hypothetical protein
MNVAIASSFQTAIIIGLSYSTAMERFWIVYVWKSVSDFMSKCNSALSPSFADRVWCFLTKIKWITNHHTHTHTETNFTRVTWWILLPQKINTERIRETLMGREKIA